MTWHLTRCDEKYRPILPVILDQSYIHLKNLVIKAERRILKELGFCVHIKHPHKIIVMFLQVLGFNNHQNLMQYSWNYMNDSLRTDVFVRYQPETVACACIYLTARKLKLPLPKHPSWFSIFGATEEDIRDISVRILKLYSRPKANIESLEKKVEDLCEKYKTARAKAKGSGNDTPNNTDSSPSQQKTTGAHNAWGGFISRSGSHIAPPINEKRSRSRSATHSPENKHRKRSKKHRSRSRSTTTSRNHKKSHKRKSFSRSRSTTPPPKSKKRGEKRKSSRSPSNDRESKNDRYIDRYEKYEKDRYKEDRDRYSEKDKYDDKKDRKEKYDRDDKYRDRDDKYSRDDRDRYKKSKHRDEEKTESRSKDRRR